MKKALGTLLFTGLMGLSQVSFATKPETAPPELIKELASYEVAPAVKEKNEVEFLEKSMKYEDSLQKLQIILVVDHSGSQQIEDAYPQDGKAPKGMFDGKWTRWDNTFMVAKYFAEAIFEVDADHKVPVVFFGNEATDVVADSFGKMLVEFKKNKPTNQMTNLKAGLTLAFDKYTPTDASESALFIVLTDGQPNVSGSTIEKEQAAAKALIAEKLAKLDPSGKRLNVLFIRVGDDDGAKAFLKDLDDSKETGELVDTKSDNMVYKMGPKNMILNAIHEHLEKDYQE